MAAITYGTAAPARAARKSWLRRIFEVVHEARMRQAERELARYTHLMPDDLERACCRLTRRTEDSLPFIR